MAAILNPYFREEVAMKSNILALQRVSKKHAPVNLSTNLNGF